MVERPDRAAADERPAAARPAGQERPQVLRALEEEFGALVRVFRQSLAAQAQRIHPELQVGEYKLLVTLARLGPLTPSHLAEQLQAARAQVSRGARVLEGLGLIERTPDPEDRRSVLLAASADGMERLREAQQDGHGTLQRTTAQWRDEDLRELTRLLHALRTGTRP